MAGLDVPSPSSHHPLQHRPGGKPKRLFVVTRPSTCSNPLRSRPLSHTLSHTLFFHNTHDHTQRAGLIDQRVLLLPFGRLSTVTFLRRRFVLSAFACQSKTHHCPPLSLFSFSLFLLFRPLHPFCAQACARICPTKTKQPPHPFVRRRGLSVIIGVLSSASHGSPLVTFTSCAPPYHNLIPPTHPLHTSHRGQGLAPRQASVARRQTQTPNFIRRAHIVISKPGAVQSRLSKPLTPIHRPPPHHHLQTAMDDFSGVLKIVRCMQSWRDLEEVQEKGKCFFVSCQ